MLPIDFVLSSSDQEVLAFCQELEGNDNIVYANCVTIDDRYKVDDCYENVKIYIKENGGVIVYGWLLYCIGGFFLEAQFHAIVQNGSDYFEVTPQSDGCTMTTFLPSSKKYEGRHISSKFRQLKENKFAYNYIVEAKEENSIYEKYSINETQIYMPEEMHDRLKEILQRREYFKRKLERQLGS